MSEQAPNPRGKVAGRPHPFDRVLKHAGEIVTEGHEVTFGTAKVGGRALARVGKILFWGTVLSVGTGFGLSEAHNLFQVNAGITEGVWPYIIGGAEEVATIGTATVAGAIGFAETSGHFAKHSAGVGAKVAETGAVGIEAVVDGIFHGVAHLVRRGRNNKNRTQA